MRNIDRELAGVGVDSDALHGALQLELGALERELLTLLRRAIIERRCRELRRLPRLHLLLLVLQGVLGNVRHECRNRGRHRTRARALRTLRIITLDLVTRVQHLHRDLNALANLVHAWRETDHALIIHAHLGRVNPERQRAQLELRALRLRLHRIRIGVIKARRGLRRSTDGRLNRIPVLQEHVRHRKRILRQHRLHVASVRRVEQAGNVRIALLRIIRHLEVTRFNARLVIRRRCLALVNPFAFIVIPDDFVAQPLRKRHARTKRANRLPRRRPVIERIPLLHVELQGGRR